MAFGGCSSKAHVRTSSYHSGTEKLTWVILGVERPPNNLCITLMFLHPNSSSFEVCAMPLYLFLISVSAALAHRHVKLLLTLRQLPSQLGKLCLQICDVGTLAVPMAVRVPCGMT